jgi:branched-chain amino acid transport system permease protein
VSQFVQALINGVALAAVYSLIALGFVVIYKSMQVLNFAGPGLVLLGVYWVVYFATVWDWPFWVAIVTAVGMSALTGVVLERVFLRPMVGKPVFAVAIMTIGIDVILRVVATDLLGLDIRPIGDPWGLKVVGCGPDAGFGCTTFGDFIVTQRQLAGVVTALVAFAALVAFFRYTRMGLAMRATAFDQEVALTQGVSVSAVFALSWAIGAVFAMAGGVFLGAGIGVDRAVSAQALKALPAVVVGGLDSVKGAVAGSLIIAIAEQLMATYQFQYLPFLGSGFSQVVPYLVMFIVLLVRPYGLFGTKEIERV